GQTGRLVGSRSWWLTWDGAVGAPLLPSWRVRATLPSLPVEICPPGRTAGASGRHRAGIRRMGAGVVTGIRGGMRKRRRRVLTRWEDGPDFKTILGILRSRQNSPGLSLCPPRAWGESVPYLTRWGVSLPRLSKRRTREFISFLKSPSWRLSFG